MTRGGAAPVAVLEIDLAAIVANWRWLAARRTGATAAVVKADGYGLGSIAVGRALFEAGCRHFFVATPDEAAALRPHVPGALLGVLNGLLPEAAAFYAEAGFTPVLGSLAELAAWRAEAGRLGRVLPALLHIDTGMHRLGLDRVELAVLADDHALLRGVEVLFVMTHLVSSECPDDPINAVQLARFEAARARLPAAPTSIANSSGMFLGADFRGDLARPGAALYGINPTPGAPNPMLSAVRLRAQVLQVRDVVAGESVGYNACWTATRPSRIATVPVGYADGFLRALTNRGCAHFDGQPVPLVGRVSMDLTTYDITDHPAIDAGGWLELIGPENPPDRLAEAAGTNGYEILTSLGPRYHRQYLNGA